MNTNLQKYLKYKSKYLDLKNELQLQVGGSYPYPSLYGGYNKEDVTQILTILNTEITDKDDTVVKFDKLDYFLYLGDSGRDMIKDPKPTLLAENQIIDLIKKSLAIYLGLQDIWLTIYLVIYYLKIR